MNHVFLLTSGIAILIMHRIIVCFIMIVRILRLLSVILSKVVRLYLLPPKIVAGEFSEDGSQFMHTELSNAQYLEATHDIVDSLINTDVNTINVLFVPSQQTVPLLTCVVVKQSETDQLTDPVTLSGFFYSNVPIHNLLQEELLEAVNKAMLKSGAEQFIPCNKFVLVSSIVDYSREYLPTIDFVHNCVVYDKAHMSMQTDDYDWEICDDYDAFFLEPTCAMSNNIITSRPWEEQCPQDSENNEEPVYERVNVDISELRTYQQSPWTAECADSVDLGMSTEVESNGDYVTDQQWPENLVIVNAEVVPVQMNYVGHEDEDFSDIDEDVVKTVEMISFDPDIPADRLRREYMTPYCVDKCNILFAHALNCDCVDCMTHLTHVLLLSESVEIDMDMSMVPTNNDPVDCNIVPKNLCNLFYSSRMATSASGGRGGPPERWDDKRRPAPAWGAGRQEGDQEEEERDHKHGSQFDTGVYSPDTPQYHRSMRAIQSEAGFFCPVDNCPENRKFWTAEHNFCHHLLIHGIRFDPHDGRFFTIDQQGQERARHLKSWRHQSVTTKEYYNRDFEKFMAARIRTEEADKAGTSSRDQVRQRQATQRNWQYDDRRTHERGTESRGSVSKNKPPELMRIRCQPPAERPRNVFRPTGPKRYHQRSQSRGPQVKKDRDLKVKPTAPLPQVTVAVGGSSIETQPMEIQYVRPQSAETKAFIISDHCAAHLRQSGLQ